MYGRNEVSVAELVVKGEVVGKRRDLHTWHNFFPVHAFLVCMEPLDVDTYTVAQAKKEVSDRFTSSNHEATRIFMLKLFHSVGWHLFMT